MKQESNWDEPVTTPLREIMDSAVRWLRSNERLLWVAVLGAFALDLGLTVYGLGLGFSEQNRLAVLLLSSYGTAGVIALKLGALVLAVGLRQLLPAVYRGLVPLALAIPWWVGALSNALNIALFLV